MAVLGPVVALTLHLLLVGVTGLVLRNAIAAQTVGGERFGSSVAFHCLFNEGQRGCLVALLRHETPSAIASTDAS